MSVEDDAHDGLRSSSARRKSSNFVLKRPREGALEPRSLASIPGIAGVAKVRLVHLVVLAQTLVAAVFAVVGLGDKPFWFDEAVSVSIAERTPGEMVEVLTKTEANMAMYYVLLPRLAFVRQ